jgi:hypothetical protein
MATSGISTHIKVSMAHASVSERPPNNHEGNVCAVGPFLELYDVNHCIGQTINESMQINIKEPLNVTS